MPKNDIMPLLPLDKTVTDSTMKIRKAPLFYSRLISILQLSSSCVEHVPSSSIAKFLLDAALLESKTHSEKVRLCYALHSKGNR